jgi:hypothetical protein
MPVKYSNNASTSLNGAITAVSTSITVNDASKFPALSGSDYTYLTLANPAGTKIEIVKVSSITGSVLTVVRGQDSTAAQAFDNSDYCELRLTAALLNDAASQDDDPIGSAVAMAIALG